LDLTVLRKVGIKACSAEGSGLTMANYQGLWKVLLYIVSRVAFCKSVCVCVCVCVVLD
jgi:hypothetical protein